MKPILSEKEIKEIARVFRVVSQRASIIRKLYTKKRDNHAFSCCI